MVRNFFERFKNKGEKDYKKLYYRTQTEAIIIIFIFLLFIYLNYNYLLFKILITGNYIYTDALDKMYDECIEVENARYYFQDFDNVMIELFTERLYETNGDKFTVLYTPAQMAKMKDIIKEDALESEVKMIDEERVYFKLTNFSKYSLDIMEDNMEVLKEGKDIIIDLRDNGGGDLPVCYDISDYFLPMGAVIGDEEARNVLFSSHNKAKNPQILNYGEIYIIQNKKTASASEVFINGLRENLDNVTVIGEKSYGKGIGQATYGLTRGYAVSATVIKLKTPKGNSIHGKGIMPDVEYDGEDILAYIKDL